MSSSVPWSVKGIDRKARETAKDLARRSGMTLGEWLNHVIEYQGEGKVTPLPQTATLNETIERLTSRIEAVETRSTLAVTGIDQSVRGLAARIDTAELGGPGDQGGSLVDALKSLESSLSQVAAQVYANEAAQKASLAEIRDELSHMARRVDAGHGEAAVDGRLAAMESQIARAEQRSTKAIEGIGKQVLLMADTVQRQVDGIDRKTTDAVQRVEGGVARLGDQIEGRLRLADEAQAAALEKLGAEIERITARLSERIGQTHAPAAFEGAEPSAFADRIRQSEFRTAALLDEARVTIDQRLEDLQPSAGAATGFSVQDVFARATAGDDLESDLQSVSAAVAGSSADPFDTAAGDDEGEDEFITTEAGAAGQTLDPFAIQGSEDPFADSTAEPAMASGDVAAAPVIYPSDEPARNGYAFAPHDFDPVEADSAEDESETLAPETLAEARSFEAVEFGAADPFSVDDEFTAETGAEATADPFASRSETYAHDDTIDDEALSIAPQATTDAAADPFGVASADEAFEPGPFGRGEQPEEPPTAEAQPSDQDQETAEAAEPAPPISYLERARAAAQQASKDDGKRGRGGFSLANFGFGGRKRGGARLKSGLMMSTAVLICLGSALAGAAMLAPLLKETGTKLTDKGSEGPEALPQAAMMTNPQPITPEITTGAGAAVVVKPDAGPVDANAAMIYAESLSLLSAKDKKGIELVKKAAEMGYPQAELQLGHLYEAGYPGLPADMTLARKWTQKAAESGLPSAMHNLAMLIYNGEGGAKSQTLAAQWFRQAAELGQVDSQFNLGLLYENGKGVQANPAEAYKWFVLASRGGDAQSRAEARTAAQRVRPLISAEAQAAAERAAQAYGAQAAAN